MALGLILLGFAGICFFAYWRLLTHGSLFFQYRATHLEPWWHPQSVLVLCGALAMDFGKPPDMAAGLYLTIQHTLLANAVVLAGLGLVYLMAFRWLVGLDTRLRDRFADWMSLSPLAIWVFAICVIPVKVLLELSSGSGYGAFDPPSRLGMAILTMFVPTAAICLILFFMRRSLVRNFWPLCFALGLGIGWTYTTIRFFGYWRASIGRFTEESEKFSDVPMLGSEPLTEKDFDEFVERVSSAIHAGSYSDFDILFSGNEFLNFLENDPVFQKDLTQSLLRHRFPFFAAHFNGELYLQEQLPQGGNCVFVAQGEEDGFPTANFQMDGKDGVDFVEFILTPNGGGSTRYGYADFRSLRRGGRMSELVRQAPEVLLRRDGNYLTHFSPPKTFRQQPLDSRIAPLAHAVAEGNKQKIEKVLESQNPTEVTASMALWQAKAYALLGDRSSWEKANAELARSLDLSETGLSFNPR